MNLGLLFVCVGLYGLNVLFLKTHTSVIFFRFYLNDVLAGALLVAYTNALIGVTPLKPHTLKHLWQMLALTFCAGLFWEFVTPLFRQSTSDPFDLIAYLIGAGIYYLVSRLFGKNQEPRPIVGVDA